MTGIVGWDIINNLKIRFCKDGGSDGNRKENTGKRSGNAGAKG